MKKLVIYGAYGYTGRLIVDQALAAGLEPHLAGRDAMKLQPLAAEKGLDWTAVKVDDRKRLHKLLADADVLLHCAGPFHRTVRQMADACIATGTHYLDITGEIDVFEYLAGRSDDAHAAGVMLLPGVGFDVVPTDCMAAHLKSRLPDATELRLAFSGGGGISRGTLLTMIDNLGEPGAIRKDGEIVPVPPAFDVIDVDFGPRSGRDSWSCMTIPWGDVSTAFHTTGIPDIRVYTAVPPKTISKMKRMRWFGWLLRRGFVRALARWKVKSGKPGPSDRTREDSNTYVWGRAENAAGKVVEARQVGPNGYSFTATAAVAAAKRVLGGDSTAGFRTPAMQFGADFCLSLGVEREDIR
ncbi:MAG: saccharopine dehydrogenase NADP-binding domain-containing protein [Gammaproteobacteria bacterium]|nr:saccharopine dehydrogenase NADP-binding domain-containing protein [Gammaproteobacteria bacterium]